MSSAAIAASTLQWPISYTDVLALAERIGLKPYDFPQEGGSRDSYLESHSKRYAHLLNMLHSVLPERGARGSTTLLDIGPSFQTRLIQTLFPDLVVDSLGFADTDAANIGYQVIRQVRRHIEFDLNDFQFDSAEPGLTRYDVITFCEVIEHLYTMPEKVLAGLRRYVNTDGVIVVQTPNAVQWRHRVRMLMGRNPFERIKPHRSGHYREYTAREMKDIAATAGCAVQSLEILNYFGLKKRAATTLVDHLLWPFENLRGGMTAVLRPLA